MLDEGSADNLGPHARVLPPSGRLLGQMRLEDALEVDSEASGLLTRSATTKCNKRNRYQQADEHMDTRMAVTDCLSFSSPVAGLRAAALCRPPRPHGRLHRAVFSS